MSVRGILRIAVVTLGLALGGWLIWLGPLTERDGAVARPARPPLQATVAVSAGAPGIPVPGSFLGISTEYWTLPLFDRHPAAFRRLLSLLRVPGDGPVVLRVGGDSADVSFWDPAGRHLPRWAYGLSPRWVREAAAVVRATGTRLILDLNLVNDTPARAAAWADAARQGLPPRSVTAFEIGNEPDLYSRQEWMATVLRSALAFAAPPPAISSDAYVRDFGTYADVLAHIAPGMPLAGPAIASPVRHVGWVRELLAEERRHVGFITVHRYPLSACASRRSRAFPTIARVLSERASVGTADAVAPIVAVARRAGVAVRVTELNSVTCGGRAGVSDTFATALWAPDTLFALVRARVAGVNIHVRAYPVNGAVGLTRAGLQPRPLLYGMLFFDRALAPGASLIPTVLHARRHVPVQAWAVRLRSGEVRVVLLDKGSEPTAVVLTGVRGARAYVERLLAPSVRARRGVTLAGQWLTEQMQWRGHFTAARIPRDRRGYVVTLPAGSGALVVIARSSAASSPVVPVVRISSRRPSRAAARSAAARVAGVGRWASHSTRV